MQNHAQKEKDLLIKLNVEEMTPLQVRLVKSINSLMAHVLTAEDESEYFEASANLMKKAAELIKHSDFASSNNGMHYAEQAVEFAVDFLNEAIDEQKLGSIDN